MQASAKLGLALIAATFAGSVHADVSVFSMDTVTGKSDPSATATGPNVSKVPGPPGPFVPIPYPNTPLDQPADPAPTAKKPENPPVLKQGSTYIKSTGDEAGTLKGVVSIRAPSPAPTPVIPPALPAVQQPVLVERAARRPSILQQPQPMLRRRP
ncbi:MAG: PAAR-like domain-containing protein [Burkholderiales bacterium]